LTVFSTRVSLLRDIFFTCAITWCRMGRLP